MGFLDYPFCAVHAVHFTEHERELAAERAVSICYNPRAMANLAAVSPIVDYLNRGLNVGLSTDGAASNDLLICSKNAFWLNAQKLV